MIELVSTSFAKLTRGWIASARKPRRQTPPRFKTACGDCTYLLFASMVGIRACRHPVRLGAGGEGTANGENFRR